MRGDTGGLRVSAAALIVALLAMMSPAVASATFPGRNGELVGVDTLLLAWDATTACPSSGARIADFETADCFVRVDSTTGTITSLGIPTSGFGAAADFSADGQRLAVAGSTASGRGILVSDADGSHLVTVAANGCDTTYCWSYGDPAWSPRGDQLAAVAACSSQPSKTRHGPFPPSPCSTAPPVGHSGSRVVVVRISNHHVRAVAAGNNVAWSSHGLLAVATSNYSARSPSRSTVSLAILRTDGKRLRSIRISTPKQNRSGVDWSPDGSKLLLDERVINDPVHHPKVHLISRDGFVGSVWSPDGHKIAYGSAATDAIGVMDINGRRAHWLTPIMTGDDLAYGFGFSDPTLAWQPLHK